MVNGEGEIQDLKGLKPLFNYPLLDRLLNNLKNLLTNIKKITKILTVSSPKVRVLNIT